MKKKKNLRNTQKSLKFLIYDMQQDNQVTKISNTSSRLSTWNFFIRIETINKDPVIEFFEL